MTEIPRETPVERFVLEHFDAIVTLKSQGYTVPDIAKVLKEEGFAAAPPTVHAALNRAAIALGKPNPYRRSPTHSDPHNADAAEHPATELPTKRPLAESFQESQLSY